LQPLPFVQVGQVRKEAAGTNWLIENIWLAQGVGLLGGQAKVCKTYLAAELSLAVATGSSALGCYPTKMPGPVLFYGAEDSLTALRERFDGLALSRGCNFQDLPVYLIDAPVLRLDMQEDLERLRNAIEKCQPRLLVLDPFVRLVSKIDENSAADVSAVLGSLRAIQRDQKVAILLVHHARKSPAANPSQAYRGSSDFAAWSDSNLFLTRNGSFLTLNLEHRSAPSPEPIFLKLEQKPAPHLAVKGQKEENVRPKEEDPLQKELHHHLENEGRALSTVELRDHVRRRKSEVIAALEKMRLLGLVRRTINGWDCKRE
jgi:hypothetical protein